MDTHEPLKDVEGDRDRCRHIYPEGHARHGQPCPAKPNRTGYCLPHSKHRQASARPTGAQPLTEPGATATDNAATAEESLTLHLAGWLTSSRTQRQLRKRWDDILLNGSDAELIRLVKEMMDRVYGRPGETRDEPAVEVPGSIRLIRAMTPAERRAALLALGD